MKPTYRVKDWDAHFETAESRKLNKTRWVPMPTKQDGKGYRRIAQHKDNVQIFCAWNLIVQVASKMPTRGVLVDEDGPLDADDLSVKTGFPSAIFAAALDFLASDKIGWMATDVQGKKPRTARVRQSPPEIPAIPQGPSLEGKGKEGNGKEEKIPSAHAELVRFLEIKIGVIPNPGKEGKAIKWLLDHGYEVEQCKRCYEFLAAETWRTSAVDWVTVQSQIGAWLQKGETNGTSQPGPTTASAKNLRGNVEYLRSIPEDGGATDSETSTRLLAAKPGHSRISGGG